MEDNPQSLGAAGARSSDATAGSAAISAIDGNADNATSDDPGPSDAPAIELATSQSELLDVFVGKLGIYVVFADELRMFDHHGALLKSRALDGSSSVSGSFDEERLSIASGSVITTYDAQLEVLYTFARPERCLLIARFSNERILCAAWYYGYTMLDGTNGTVLSGADYLFFSGPPLSRIPGRDAFVLNGGTKSLSNVSLLSLTPDSRVLLLDEATLPEVGVFNAYGFDGSTSPNLISDSGQQVGLRTDCAATTDRSSAPCFVPGNPSASVPAGRELTGIAPGPAEHQFFGLIAPVRSDPVCRLGGCELELIDDLGDRVLRQRHLESDGATNLLAFRWDAQARAVVLGLGYVTSTLGIHYSVVLQPF